MIQKQKGSKYDPSIATQVVEYFTITLIFRFKIIQNLNSKGEFVKVEKPKGDNARR